MGLQNIPLPERSECFYVTISGSFARFQHFNYETNFVKNEDHFQNTGVPFENTTFPYKTALSEANVKKNRMKSTNWTDQKE